jgi:magnesium transporter
VRVFHIHPQVEEHATPPAALPDSGFVWIACSRPEFEAQSAELNAVLQRLCGSGLLDLHISDLLNAQIPSHYDYTSQYDLMVFRRLATLDPAAAPSQTAAKPVKHHGPPVLRRIDTSPVGVALFDRVLLTVHPADCAVRDLMLRLLNTVVDGYLDLRRELTRQLDHWQTELLNSKSRFRNWSALLEARITLHQLDEIAEDQRSAMQDWIDALESWSDAQGPERERELELLKVRSRDVLEHIERVVHHVRRLEQSAETAVQIHFSLQGQRTNDIMRTLTVFTAVFLPLNFMTGFFGMNFEFLPWIHRAEGLWWALGIMGTIVSAMGLYFWRKRYLD